MLAFEEALARLLAGAAPLPAETLPLAAAVGRVLAGDVHARLTQPPFDTTAMDGYAIRWADVARPWQVVGEAAAGHGWGGRLAPGEAVRIFTGAPLPAGADTIVVQEDVVLDGDTARLCGEGPPRAGAHVRPGGQDFGTGDRLAVAGAVLTPARLGLIAAGGHGSVAVVRRPIVQLIATGDELVPPGATPGPGQIANGNGVMLAALLRGAGAVVNDPGIVPDTRLALTAALRAARDADIIITVGGASVGDHDLVVPVLRDLGADLDFWKIAMRPGKPLLAGHWAGTRIVGLPGNPVSAYVCALLFLRPLLARLNGRTHAHDMKDLVLAAPLPANGPRRDHPRGVITADGRARAFERQDSALLGVLAAAELLIIREPDAPAAAAGDIVRCILLDTFPDVA